MKIKVSKEFNETNHNSRELTYKFAKVYNLKSGSILNDRYQIEGLLGKGGFGIVFKANDLVLKTPVALKFLNPLITRNKEKFLRIQREIKISRNISDESIVKIFSLDKYQEVIFLVMEFIDGVPLSNLLKPKKSMSWDEFQPIFIQVLKAVNVLHQNDIIHRDLKPGNIMVKKNGSIKIVDFGLAKKVIDRERTSSTDEISGTVEYISPEQISGEDLDIRSDIYQLGLLLFKALTGEHPIEAETTMEMLVKYITIKPKNIAKLKKGLPLYLEYIAVKMLEPNRNYRFKDIGEILSILEKEDVNSRVKSTLFFRKYKQKLLFLFPALFLLIGVLMLI